MAAEVKVSEHGLGMLWPRLNVDPLCGDSSTEGKCSNAI